MPIEVSLNGQLDGFRGGRPEPLLFSFYRQPAVSLVTPRGGPSAGGTVLSLFGAGFGALGTGARAAPYCLLGRGGAADDALARPMVVARLLPGRVECVAPAAVAGSDALLALALNGAEFAAAASPAGRFAYYEEPRLAQLAPPRGPVRGGSLVTLTRTLTPTLTLTPSRRDARSNLNSNPNPSPKQAWCQVEP